MYNVIKRAFIPYANNVGPDQKVSSTPISIRCRSILWPDKGTVIAIVYKIQRFLKRPNLLYTQMQYGLLNRMKILIYNS